MFRVFLFIVSIYILIGFFPLAISYNRWQKIKGFKSGPVSVLVGIIFWPWVLKTVLTSKESAREPESSKEWKSLRERVDIILSDDRSKEKCFLDEWFRDYFSEPKIDPEKIYHKRIYL